MPTATANYGETIRARREAEGLSLEKVTQRAARILPDQNCRSYGMLYRIENGEVPEDEVDLIFVVGVACVLGLTRNDFPESIRDGIKAAEQAIASWDWIAA